MPSTGTMYRAPTDGRRLDSRKVMRLEKPRRVALRWAMTRAAGEMSVAKIWAAGSSFARATAMQPEPVPMSAMERFSPVSLGGRPALSSRTARRSRATSIRCSVSGRGIRTSGVTSKSRPQNSWWPVRCCVGSPAARRLEESEIGFGGLGVEEFFGMGIEPSAVAAKNVEKEKFGGESVRRDAGFAEEMDSLLEGGADIEGIIHRSRV